MRLILSPTKTMDIQGSDMAMGVPAFESQALELNRQLAQLDREQIRALYKTSPALTDKTLEQIREFKEAAAGPALFVFRGEAFKTLDPQGLSQRDIEFAREYLWILSGLYGILAPMDGIRPYRLDLNTPLNPGGKSLTAFWKKRVVSWAEAMLAPGEPILNLASDEYAALLARSDLAGQMITLQFRQREGDTLKNNSVRAKQARGLFARAVIQHRIQDPEQLKTLRPGGYVYCKAQTAPDQWMFIRSSGAW